MGFGALEFGALGFRALGFRVYRGLNQYRLVGGSLLSLLIPPNPVLIITAPTLSIRRLYKGYGMGWGLGLGLKVQGCWDFGLDFARPTVRWLRPAWLAFFAVLAETPAFTASLPLFG